MSIVNKRAFACTGSLNFHSNPLRIPSVFILSLSVALAGCSRQSVSNGTSAGGSLLFGGKALTAAATTSCPSPVGQDGTQFSLAFQDEFDGTSLDTSKWNDHIYYDPARSTNDYGVSNGSLKIWPQPASDGNFYERILTTQNKYQQTYGYFEIEAKLPIGKGPWPAFWLLNSDPSNPPDNSGNPGEPEIDIMEAYSGDDGGYWADSNHHPIRFDATYFQTGANTGGQTNHYAPYTGDLSTSFHTYGLKWEANQLTYYFDGKQVFTDTVSMSKPMYILLDLQYGSASGMPDSTTPLGPSNAFEIHYMRSWTLGGGSGICSGTSSAPSSTPTSSPTSTSSPSSSSGSPDMVVTSVSMSPANPVAGQAVTFSATIKNQGTAATPAGVVNGVLFSVDGNAVSWSDNNSSSIPAGGSITVTASGGPSGSAAWTATSGSHTVDAWVNDVARYAESNTSNNHLTKSISVAAISSTPSPTPTATATPTATPTPALTASATQSSGSPDMIVTSISMSPANPVAGQAVTFSATIKNQGTAATPAGVVNGVLFSVDGNAVSWSDNNSSSIPAGGSVTVTASGGPSGSAAWKATSGSHTVDAFVNDVARYAESNTSNNHLTKSISVAATSSTPSPTPTATSTPTPTPTASQNTGSPDMIVTSISMSPANPVAGQAVTFSATIKNQGTGATPAGVVNGVLFSVDGNAVSWSDNNSSSIPAGGSVTVTASGGPSGSAAWTATSGSHTVDAFVNDVARYAESNTSNNHLTKSISVAATSTGSTSSSSTGSATSGSSVPLGGPSGFSNLKVNDSFGSSKAGANFTSLSQFNSGTYGASGSGWDDHMCAWDCGKANLSMASDHLEIRPTGGSSGFISSHFEYLPSGASHVYWEIRAATGRGDYTGGQTWPAFWLFAGNEPGSNNAQSEFDLMETYFSQQWGPYDSAAGGYTRHFVVTTHPNANSTGESFSLSTDNDITINYNVYGCDVYKKSDGNLYFDIYFNGTFMKSTSVGLTWNSSAPSMFLGWNPGSTSLSPAVMNVDYVKAWIK